MRWIACCVLAAGVGLAISTLMIRHFGGKPSNPNLVELGLTDDLNELAAPSDPEPAVQKVPMASQGAPTNEVIDLFAKPINPAWRSSRLWRSSRT